MKQNYENIGSLEKAPLRASCLLSWLFISYFAGCAAINVVSEICHRSFLCFLQYFERCRVYSCFMAVFALLYPFCLALVDKLWHKTDCLLYSASRFFAFYELWHFILCRKRCSYARGWWLASCKYHTLFRNLGYIYCNYSCQRDLLPSCCKKIAFPSFHQSCPECPLFKHHHQQHLEIFRRLQRMGMPSWHDNALTACQHIFLLVNGDVALALQNGHESIAR